MRYAFADQCPFLSRWALQQSLVTLSCPDPTGTHWLAGPLGSGQRERLNARRVKTQAVQWRFSWLLYIPVKTSWGTNSFWESWYWPFNLVFYIQGVLSGCTSVCLDLMRERETASERERDSELAREWERELVRERERDRQTERERASERERDTES